MSRPNLEIPTTDWIDPNEGAILYSERILPGPLYKGHHRYQVIRVIRNDAPADYENDLGLATNFVGGVVEIPGGMWNYGTGKGRTWDTVARLEAIGEQLRHRTPEEADALLAEQGYEYTEGTAVEWQEEYLKEADRRKMAASKKSVNGTHFSITR